MVCSRQIARVRAAMRSSWRLASSPSTAWWSSRPTRRSCLWQSDDGGGAGIVGVGLVTVVVVQQPHPGGQLRWHVDHHLAGCDELLGEQRAGPAGALNGPPPRHEPVRPAQQVLSLLAVGGQMEHRLHPLVPVEHGSSMSAPVGVDPDHEHDIPPHRRWCATAGRPDEVVCRSCCEPRRDERPAGGPFVQKPHLARSRQGIQETTDRTLRRYASCRHPPSGHSVHLVQPVDGRGGSRRIRRYAVPKAAAPALAPRRVLAYASGRNGASMTRERWSGRVLSATGYRAPPALHFAGVVLHTCSWGSHGNPGLTSPVHHVG